MFLERLNVERYRALREAQLNFDDSTVLIGENDCGKSSLLEALALTLDPVGGVDPPRFLPWHFHRTAPHLDAPFAGPIRIELQFRERRVGEWAAFGKSPLGEVVGAASDRSRRMRLEFRSKPPKQNVPSTATWSVQGEDGRKSNDPAVLAQIRQVAPVIWLHGGELLTTPGQEQATGRGQALPPEAVRMIAHIERTHAALLAGTAMDMESTLAEGFEAASAFLGQAARHLGPQQHDFGEMVSEILGPRQAQSESRPHRRLFAGSSAERIGGLALTAALLRAVPGALAEGTDPIWLIEDPEVQLHPMTLAAVLALMDRIRWQKVITTQSGEVLADEPLSSLRRLVRRDGVVREWRVRPNSLSREDLRRVSYHLRGRRGVATFARCWLLVEGETEFWMLPELARLAGHDFGIEGIACVEYAQCGLPPLIKLADQLGIEWHVLTDGDQAGEKYRDQARRFLRGVPLSRRITFLPERDIEHCFYSHGFEPAFRQLAKLSDPHAKPRQVIKRAIDRHSKPRIALELVLAAASKDAPPVPKALANTIQLCVELARDGV